MNLIDPKALLDVMEHKQADLREPFGNYAILGFSRDLAKSMVRKQPTIEAIPVVHGQWVDRYRGKYANPIYDCSECGEAALYKSENDELGTHHFVQALSNVCPHCGAQMDGDEK